MLADARPRARKTGGVAYYTRRPKHAKTRSFPREYVENCFGPRTTSMPADRLAAGERYDSDRLLRGRERGDEIEQALLFLK